MRKRTLKRTLRNVGEKLIQNHQNLVGRLGEEKLGNLIERNRRILSRIEPGTNKIKGEAALLFPKDKAVSIMKWYTSLKYGLEEYSND